MMAKTAKIKSIHATPKEKLTEFLRSVDNYDSVVLIGRNRKDGSFDVSYSYMSLSEVLGACEIAKTFAIQTTAENDN